MTGIEKLRELADGIDAEVSVWMCAGDAYNEAHGLSHADDGGPIGAALAGIASQIEREHEGDLTQYHVPWSKVQDVMLDMERHVSGVEGMDDSPVARWARELWAALGRQCRDGESDSVADSPYDAIRPEDREAIAWVREHGGLEMVRRMFRDADNRRVELCGALGIDLDKGWSEAMAAMRLRLLPKGHHLLEDHDGEPIVPGDARFGRSDGKRWVIDAVGHDFVWSGLSQTARKRGERPVRLRPEWLTKERPAPMVSAGDGRPLVVGEFVWHKSGVVGGVVESVDAGSLMHTVRYRSRRGEEYRDAARDLVHDFPDSWERWVEDSKLHPSKYVDRYRVGRIGYEELDMNRDLVRRAKALAGGA